MRRKGLCSSSLRASCCWSRRIFLEDKAFVCLECVAVELTPTEFMLSFKQSPIYMLCTMIPLFFFFSSHWYNLSQFLPNLVSVYTIRLALIANHSGNFVFKVIIKKRAVKLHNKQVSCSSVAPTTQFILSPYIGVAQNNMILIIRRNRKMGGCEGEGGRHQLAIFHHALLTSCDTPSCSNYSPMSTFNIYLLGLHGT